MRLIIEVNNDEEFKKAQSLIASHFLESIEIQKVKKRSRKEFVQWCRENKTSITDIPSREERHER